MSDVYNFSTTKDDLYWNRVVAEADPATNVILIVDELTDRRGDAGLVLLLRESFVDKLAEKYPNTRIAGTTLGDLYLDRQANPRSIITGFYLSILPALPVEEAEHQYVVVKNEIRHLLNLYNDKTVRVRVESF